MLSGEELESEEEEICEELEEEVDEEGKLLSGELLLVGVEETEEFPFEESVVVVEEVVEEFSEDGKLGAIGST